MVPTVFSIKSKCHSWTYVGPCAFQLVLHSTLASHFPLKPNWSTWASWTLHPLTVVPGPWDPSHLQLSLTLANFYSFSKTWFSCQCSLWFSCSQCGLCTSSILSISWEPVRNAESQALPQIHWVRNLHLTGTPDLCAQSNSRHTALGSLVCSLQYPRDSGASMHCWKPS